jgi:hypothetical protein
MIEEMVAEVVSVRTLLITIGVYCIAPYAVLWVVVRCWPKGHDRRAEYLAEYDAVAPLKRPFWVADATIRSLLDGTQERLRIRRLRPLKMRPEPKRFRTERFARGQFPIHAAILFVPGAVLCQALNITNPWVAWPIVLVLAVATLEAGADLLYRLRRALRRRHNAKAAARSLTFGART